MYYPPGPLLRCYGKPVGSRIVDAITLIPLADTGGMALWRFKISK